MSKLMRTLGLLLAIIMIFSLVACDTPTTDTGTATPSSKPESTDNTANVESTQSPTEIDIHAKYDPPVTVVTTVNSVSMAPEGMDPLNNPYHDGWLEELGINVEYAFIADGGDDYTTKMNMLLASDEMPDMCWVDAETYLALQEDDMLADLTDVFATYASERTMFYYNQDGGRRAKNVTVDGRMMAITAPPGYEDNIGLVAIRKDWLEELNLEAPKDINDLWDIAKAFKESKPGGATTIGIGATQDTMGGIFTKLMNAYGSYNDMWLEKDGALVYSGIQPERRHTLEQLSAKFSEGLLDPEFGTKKQANVLEDCAAGRTGILINGFTAPFVLLNAAKSGQEWGWYPLLTESGDVATVQVNVGFDGALVVRKGYEHPEVAVKLINYFTKNFVDNPEIYGIDGINNFSWPYSILSLINKNSIIHEYYIEYLKTGVMPADENIGNDLTNTIEQGELFNKSGDMEGWIMWNVFGPEGTEKLVVVSRDLDAYQLNAFMGVPTDSMATTKSVLKTMEEQMLTSIINGSQPIESFDEFVNTWKSSGGDEMTKEVNEWYAKQEK